MSGGYYYLVASLPHLRLGAAPRLTPGEFLRRCAAQVSAAHFRILTEVELFQVQPTGTGLALLDRWHERERALRNALAVVRANRLGVATAAHLRDFRHDHRLAEIARHLLTLDSPLAADEGAGSPSLALFGGTGVRSLLRCGNAGRLPVEVADPRTPRPLRSGGRRRAARPDARARRGTRARGLRPFRELTPCRGPEPSSA